MTPPSNDRGRPLAEPASHVDHHDDSSVGPRCWICGHAISAERSLALGVGPKCWRRHRGRAVERGSCCTSLTFEEIGRASALGLFCSERLCVRQALEAEAERPARLTLLDGGAS